MKDLGLALRLGIRLASFLVGDALTGHRCVATTVVPPEFLKCDTPSAEKTLTAESA